MFNPNQESAFQFIIALIISVKKDFLRVMLTKSCEEIFEVKKAAKITKTAMGEIQTWKNLTRKLVPLLNSWRT
jgi:hypothetical protein